MSVLWPNVKVWEDVLKGISQTMHPQLHASVSAWMNRPEFVWNWASKWTASKVRLDWLAASITSSLYGICWIMLSVNNEFQNEKVCLSFNKFLPSVCQISLHGCLIFFQKSFENVTFSINYVTIYTFITKSIWYFMLFFCASITLTCGSVNFPFFTY